MPCTWTSLFFLSTLPLAHGKISLLHKFRTMTDAGDAQGNLLAGTERPTLFIRLLRVISVDELPELWNMLKGVVSRPRRGFGF